MHMKKHGHHWKECNFQNLLHNIELDVLWKLSYDQGFYTEYVAENYLDAGVLGFRIASK